MKHIAKLFVISLVVLSAGSLLAQNNAATTVTPYSLIEGVYADVSPQCSTGLVYDDGTFENGYGWNAGFGWGRWAMLFTPASYPFTINQVCVALTRTAAGSPTWTFNIVMFSAPSGGSGPPVDSLWSTNVTANNVPTWTTVSFFDFPVSGVPAITSGSVYIAISYDPNVNAAHYIGADQSTTTTLRAGYGFIQNSWTPAQTFFPSYRAFGIRVEGSGQTYAHDIATGPFLGLPQYFVINTQYQMKTRVSNVGTSNETGVPIKWFINNTLTNTTNINLNAGQNDSVTNNWTPTTPGTYTLKYVSDLATDQNRSNDTVQVTRQVYTSIPFPLFNCCITNATYTPITGTPGPFGDDQTIQATIPFSFTYNGTAYTTVSICTNGWIAMGSTTLTTYSNNLCATSGIAPNLIALFWDDFNPASGQIQYTTLGTTPNRIFVVQYASVPWLVGGGGFTGQVRLYETSNVIEFVYGTGTAPSSSSGSVGLTWGAGGPGNVQSLQTAPGTCGPSDWSNTTCNDALVYNTTNFPNGKMYEFYNCLVGIQPISGEVPNVYSLSQNYPNPFNPKTIISYGIPKSGNVKLVVYDLLGRQVATLVNEFQQAGRYNFDFDGSNLASGMYIYKLESGNFTDSKKMLLVK